MITDFIQKPKEGGRITYTTGTDSRGPALYRTHEHPAESGWETTIERAASFKTSEAMKQFDQWLCELLCTSSEVM